MIVRSEKENVWLLSKKPVPSSRHGKAHLTQKEGEMPNSVYKIVELVGTSTDSWEKAAANAVDQASKSLRDLRIAEVVELDMQIEDGKVIAYRAKVKVSFKFEG
jgi:flavin-binding protein dodecin